MKINWKIRFQNKIFLAAFISLIINFAFDLLTILDVVPVITRNMVLQLANQVLTCLAALGIIVDPTTAGIGDSNRAMQYDWPWDDEVDTDCTTPHVPRQTGENG